MEGYKPPNAFFFFLPFHRSFFRCLSLLTKFFFNISTSATMSSTSATSNSNAVVASSDPSLINGNVINGNVIKVQVTRAQDLAVASPGSSLVNANDDTDVPVIGGCDLGVAPPDLFLLDDNVPIMFNVQVTESWNLGEMTLSGDVQEWNLMEV